MKRSGWQWLALLLSLVLLAGCGEAEAPAPESAAPAPTETAAPTPPVLETAEPSPTPEATEAVEEQTLVLWLAEDAPLCESLEALAEDYCAQYPERLLRVFRFSDEDELSLALAQGRPDLLLCSGGQAAALAAEGKLSASIAKEAALPLRPYFQSAPEGFFPLGGELPVLAVKEENRALLPEGGSLEDFCAQAEDYARRYGRPYFSADSSRFCLPGRSRRRGAPFMPCGRWILRAKPFRKSITCWPGAPLRVGWSCWTSRCCRQLNAAI